MCFHGSVYLRVKCRLYEIAAKEAGWQGQPGLVVSAAFIGRDALKAFAKIVRPAFRLPKQRVYL